MKKILSCIILLIMVLFVAAAVGEQNNNWDSAPTITVAYEISAEKLYLKWEGNSLLYQVQMDGKRIMDVGQSEAIIPVKKGTHTILVYPVISEKTDNNKIAGNINAMGSLGLDFSLDLSSLGIGNQDLIYGNVSNPLYIDYNPNPILNAVPEKLSATTIENDTVKLSFVDRYNADEYFITIKSGNDNNFIQFNALDDSASFISREKGFASVVLDSDYLSSKNCMIPEVNEKYSFQVQLRKYAVNLIDNEKIKTVMLESKPSKWYDYTPIAAWKTAPVITFASQTADGQVKIAWEHDNFGVDVAYSVVKNNKALFVKTGEEIIGETKEHEFIINDLTNGNYSLSVVPKNQNESGPNSDEINIEVKNDWVTAPKLECEQIGNNQVKLNWTAPENIESYHITVYTGDSGSLLRFVDGDYKKVSENDVDAVAGPMEFIYTFEGSADNDAAIRLKFELYGIHHTQSGDEQKSAVSSATIVLE